MKKIFVAAVCYLMCVATAFAPVTLGGKATLAGQATFNVPPPMWHAATFDGSNDYLSRGADLTGNSNSKVGLVSVWFQTTSATDTAIMGNGSLRFLVVASTTLQIDAYNSSDVLIMRIRNNVDIRDGQWHHLMASWDLSDVAKRWMYVDGVDVLLSPTYTDATISYTGSGDWRIGTRGDAFAKFNGCLAEPFFANEYFDLSISGNRLKFYNAGSVVSAGVNGSTPTGNQPLIYVPALAWTNSTINVGSGGTFTTVGSLESCAIP